jgi:hypothetical protein
MTRSRFAIRGLAILAAMSGGCASNSETAAELLAPSLRADSGVYEGPENWMCRPGLPNNPCTAKLSVTDVLPDGSKQRSELPATDDNKAADCFFAYATVDPGLFTPPRNLDFRDIDRAAVAELVYGQARPFRELCNIYSPIYRQASLNTYEADEPTRQTHLDYAYRDIREAFDYMLEHSEPDRPIILLSHSQGSHHTMRLLEDRFATDPALKKRLVVAILAGPLGGYWVPRGETQGGRLMDIPLCTSAQETGCVVTFNTFLEANPPNEGYGHATRLLPEGDNDLGCNPGFYTTDKARLRGATFVAKSPSVLSIALFDWSRLRIDTDYARFADFYTGQCKPAVNGLSYLSIDVEPSADDKRTNPVLFDGLVLSDPKTGLHAIDYAFVATELIKDVETKLTAATGGQ